MIDIKPQSAFPHLKRYKKVFTVTDETIFAYNSSIYTNHPLPADIMVHELTHLTRQSKYGVEKWVNKYLNDINFRFNEELIAYKEQLKGYQDRNEKAKCRIQCANALASELYGNIIDYQSAYKLLS